ncbi:MAG: hypothetical protein L0241_01395, partial [Planctomycetia bacterium]|nr:hypothetical protein [Planctomycetia bacterium]
MAQGKRSRLRIVAAGLGVMLCTGLVGCWNTDGSKEKFGKQPPGLHGTPTLPGNATGTNKNGMPVHQFGSGVQPATKWDMGGQMQPGAGYGNYPNVPNPYGSGIPTQPGMGSPSGIQPISGSPTGGVYG